MLMPFGINLVTGYRKKTTCDIIIKSNPSYRILSYSENIVGTDQFITLYLTKKQFEILKSF